MEQIRLIKIALLQDAATLLFYIFTIIVFASNVAASSSLLIILQIWALAYVGINLSKNLDRHEQAIEDCLKDIEARYQEILLSALSEMEEEEGEHA